MSGKMLEISNLTVKYGDFIANDNISFSVSEGEWLMLLGPNGAGKSTVINAIAGGAPSSGDILYMGEKLSELPSTEKAKHIGILSQSHFVGYDFTVEEVVRLGRYAYSPSPFAKKKDIDDDYVRDALEMTGLTELRDHSVLSLSGGELQRTFLAQLFAQNPDILILDEPSNHLDLAYQKQVFELVGKWRENGRRAVISVVHDLGLARTYGTHALLLDHGHIIANDVTEKVFESDLLNKAYNINVSEWMRFIYSGF